MKIENLFLVAGHSHADSGAVANHAFEAGPINLRENDLTIELRNLLYTDLSQLIGYNIFKDNDGDSLSVLLGKLRHGTGANDLVIDLHFNAASNKAATGVEIFVKDNATDFEKKLALEVSDTISRTLDITNRGVKTQIQSNRGRLGIFNIPANVILVEVCFLSNKSDMKSYIKNKHILVSRLSDKIAELI